MWWRLDVDDFHHYHAFVVHVLGKKLDKHGISHRFYQIWEKNKENENDSTLYMRMSSIETILTIGIR